MTATDSNKCLCPKLPHTPCFCPHFSRGRVIKRALGHISLLQVTIGWFPSGSKKKAHTSKTNCGPWVDSAPWHVLVWLTSYRWSHILKLVREVEKNVTRENYMNFIQNIQSTLTNRKTIHLKNGQKILTATSSRTHRWQINMPRDAEPRRFLGNCKWKEE